MKLQNISNQGSHIDLFIRNDDGSLTIKHDKNFLPYYYEVTTGEGEAVSLFGETLKKIYCIKPGDIKKQRSMTSYEADIIYPKRYILDKIPTFEKSPTRVIYFDIEVDCTELPKPKENQEAKDPVSCITMYDNYEKEYKTFFIEDYKSEYDLLQAFCAQIKKLQPDLLVAWNVNFDYYYLYYRIGEEFPKLISPIGQIQWRNGFKYPAGISIVDMLGLYAKYTLHKKDSYALMNVAHEELDYKIEEDFDFTDIHEAKRKNLLDVEKMVKLDEKLNLFKYFDEIRILTRCYWEDLPSEMRNYAWQSNNSKIIDMLALEEAKRLNVALPSKRQDNEKGDVEGAYRETFGTGLYKDLAKVDLSGAYPQAIIDFCLSPENYTTEDAENTIKIPVFSRKTGELKQTYYIKQNPTAVVPSLTSRLLKMKNELKKKLNDTNSNAPEYKQLQIAYDSRKALVNSAFGVFGMPYFRLYDSNVADTITFLIRDLLHYVKAKLESQNYGIQYFDTDSIFLHGKEDITEQLNKWSLEWGMDKYRNSKVQIEFDYEGYFSSIFIQALCRYRGRLERPEKGQKIETKGIQMKRKDSNIWIKDFQKKLYDLILDNNTKETIIGWLKEQIIDMQKVDILTVAVPCKFNMKRADYKKQEIFFRAIDNTKELIPEFKKEVGDRFWWVYTKGEKDVYAIDKNHVNHIPEIDWPAMIKRNVLNLLVPIFKGLNWECELLELSEEYSIIFGSQHRNKLLQDLPDFEEKKQYYSAREVKKRRKLATLDK